MLIPYVEIKTRHPTIIVPSTDRPPLGDSIRIVDRIGNVSAQTDGRSLGHSRQHLAAEVRFGAQKNAFGAMGNGSYPALSTRDVCRTGATGATAAPTTASASATASALRLARAVARPRFISIPPAMRTGSPD